MAPLPPQQTEQKPQNSLLNFVTPTEFVELPSKGLYYPEGHPLKGKNTIEVKHMTAKDEDTLSSPSLLKEGVALDRMLNNIIINKQISTDSLLIGDKNAILIAARKTGYGNVYQTEVICPNCGKKDVHEFGISQTERVHHGLVPEHAKLNEKGNFEISLPSSKVNLEIKLLRGEDEKKIIKMISSQKTSTMIDHYRMMIVSANGVTDKKLLFEFIDLMPIKDAAFLKKTYKSLNPNVELKHNFQCYSCNHTQELEVPFGADFFWPNR
tara:strand:+ start:71 stop:871 length:801 start_codon:yes stop_codon:yes gene_type:complete